MNTKVNMHRRGVDHDYANVIEYAKIVFIRWFFASWQIFDQNEADYDSCNNSRNNDAEQNNKVRVHTLANSIHVNRCPCTNDTVISITLTVNKRWARERERVQMKESLVMLCV